MKRTCPRLFHKSQLHESGWGPTLIYNVDIICTNDMTASATDASASFDAKGRGYVSAWMNVYDYVYWRWKQLRLGSASGDAHASANCEVYCSDCCNIMITCTGTPITDGFEAYDKTPLSPNSGSTSPLLPNIYRGVDPGNAIAGIKWQRLVIGSIGSVSATLSAGYSVKLPKLTKTVPLPFSGGGVGFVWPDYPHIKVPDPFSVNHNFVWECKK